MTYRQAQELGGQVPKDEHGSAVVYADRFKRTETSESGEEIENEIPFLKAYTVFNCEQIDGLPERYYPMPAAPMPAPARIETAVSFIIKSVAAIRHGGNQAFYACSADHIQLPPFESFRDPESYYATLLHELTHWTRHPSRLAREFGRKRWGDSGCAAEELVAELGAAFQCPDLGITPAPREDHAAYLASWLEVMKSDKRAIFTAAAYGCSQRKADAQIRSLSAHSITGSLARDWATYGDKAWIPSVFWVLSRRSAPSSALRHRRSKSFAPAKQKICRL